MATIRAPKAKKTSKTKKAPAAKKAKTTVARPPSIRARKGSKFKANTTGKGTGNNSFTGGFGG